MRAVVQRVREAAVSVGGAPVGAIGEGLLVLCGITASDGDADRDWLAHKIVSLRIFNDKNGVMNRSLAEVGGGLLAVSQFTLFASTRKGARPSTAPPHRQRSRHRCLHLSFRRWSASRADQSQPDGSART